MTLHANRGSLSLLLLRGVTEVICDVRTLSPDIKAVLVHRHSAVRTEYPDILIREDIPAYHTSVVFVHFSSFHITVI